MKLAVQPLTPDLWPAFEDLFGKNGACNGCWCMYWRVGSAYRKRPAGSNKVAFRQVVNQGPPPGLLAFHGALAVGWCQLTPRSALPWIDRSWRLKRVDEIPVWSLSCLYVRIGYRKRGVTSRLIQAALRAAKRARAPALEAYPFDAGKSPSASGTGYRSPDSKPSPAELRPGRSCAMTSPPDFSSRGHFAATHKPRSPSTRR